MRKSANLVFIGTLLLGIASALGMLVMYALGSYAQELSDLADEPNTTIGSNAPVYVIGIVSIILLVVGIWLIVSNVQLKP